MSFIKSIETQDQLDAELSSAGDKLVVVYYTADWCAPCKKIKPVFLSLPEKYQNVVFCLVDVDVCQEMVLAQGVVAMPTFVFHKNKEKIEILQGPEPAVLEEKINQHIQKDETEVNGHQDLSSLILKNQCECLNESDSQPLSKVFEDNDDYLESDTDGQLMISITFQQPVRLHSVKLKAPELNGPKQVKIFINQPNTLDFASGESNTPVQEFELTPDQLKGDPIRLQYVKYQSVINIQFFVKMNQTGTEKTVINQMGFIGTPLSSTNMGDFRRVSGKKGEIC